MKDAKRRKAHELVLEYRILVGQIVESLEFYDADDGHNQLVLVGVVAELKRLNDVEDTLWPKTKRRR